MELIVQAGKIIGILIIVLICFYSFHRNQNILFLGASIFFLWYSLITTHLNYTREILEHPALIRTGLLAGFLMFPFLFYYSRNTFYPGRLWRRTDWILLIPAIIYAFDMLPFFLSTPGEKVAAWQQSLADKSRFVAVNEGWLLWPGFHFLSVYISMLIILFLQFRLIARNWNMDKGFQSRHNRSLLFFILILTLLFVPVVLPGVFGLILNAPWFGHRYLVICFSLSLIALSLYLFISPRILYGFIPEIKFSSQSAMSPPQPDPELIQSSETTLKNTELNTTPTVNWDLKIPDHESMLSIITRLMEEKKQFQRQGYTIQDLSHDSGIPVYQLSPCINQYFKKSFTQWVNHYRIEYVVEQAKANGHLTLEALSKMAGFVSRSTFITAFKREKGTTPREYFKSFRQSISH